MAGLRGRMNLVDGGPRPAIRALVVEDDSSIRSALVVALQREGFQVRANSDATAIADVANDFRPDIAILDVRLPVGPDGYTAARILRHDLELAIIFLSAADGIGLDSRALVRGPTTTS